MLADVGSSARRGLATLKRHKKAVLLLCAANLLVALLLLPGLLVSVEDSLGSSIYRQKLAEGLDLEWFAVYQTGSPSPLAETLSPMVSGAGPLVEQLQRWLQLRIDDLPWMLLAPAIFFWLVYSFLLGGALASAALDPAGSSWREFLRTSAEFWGRFLRLGILSGTVLVVLAAFVLRPLQRIWNVQISLLADGRLEAWGSLAGYLLLLIVFAGLHLLFSYARVITAGEDRRSILLAFFAGFRFCLNRPLSVLLLAFSFALLLALWYLLWMGLGRLFPADGLWGIALGFASSQLCFLGYVALRYWFYLSELELFQTKYRRS